MKVIYKKSIVEKIDEEIFKAAYDNKQIEEIILTEHEWDELFEKIDLSFMSSRCFIKNHHKPYFELVGGIRYNGTLVRKQDEIKQSGK